MHTDVRRRRSVVTLARALRAAHDSIDAAIGGSAEALAVAMRLRTEEANGMPGTVGQPEIVAMLSGLAKLGEVRGEYILAHVGVADLGINRGFITKAEGDLTEKPPWNEIQLEVVATNSAAA